MNKIKHSIKHHSTKVKAAISSRKKAKEGILDNVPVPRITNDTVAEHREEVLNSARKYIYPLQHSKHKIILFSTAIIIAATVGFFSYCVLALYRFQSTSSFVYHVTQVLPFPIAKAGSSYVSYESYLFELRHYMHYYEEQQKLSFDSESGRQQLTEFKKRALDRVIDDAYIKQIAKDRNLTVTDQEVTAEIDVLRKEDRLGESEKVFEDVLRDYWGWSINDFRRSVRQQLLSQRVLADWDAPTRQRAEVALAELKNGKDFAEVARANSDDLATKDAGGDISFQIERTNRDISAKTISALFSLQPGDYSDIIDIGYGLEIVKLRELKDGKATADRKSVV